ncbi:MAG TPA: hypothetical protein PK777_13190 [Thermoguttaceae bacterium]|nr:hypothetical protein [Thermoguttaceae bacterium]
MYYGFETNDENAALGALLVYGIYRSRDIKRFKVTPDMWGIIERAVKSSAKRALDLHDFIEKLKPRLMCSTLKPKWMETDEEALLRPIAMVMNRETGEIIQKQDKGRRQFWVEILEQIDHQEVLDILYKKTSWVIALVRDRLERERPLEISGIIKEDEEDEE